MRSSDEVREDSDVRTIAATPSDRLHRKIELVMPPLVSASRRFLSHPRIGQAYPEFLIAVHGMIRGSVPLMRTALERARAMSRDRVADALDPYLEGHIEEEIGHDEWVLEDLEVLGVERSTVLLRVPAPAVARMIGAQYYWSLHYHPVALLGHLAVLEGYPSAPAVIERLRERTGHSPGAFRTLEEHAELDPHHGDELDRLIDSLPLLPEHEEVLGLSAMSSMELMARCIDDVCDTVGGEAASRADGSPFLSNG